MKRIISLIICAVFVLGLSACGEKNTQKDNSNGAGYQEKRFKNLSVILNGTETLLLD